MKVEINKIIKKTTIFINKQYKSLKHIRNYTFINPKIIKQKTRKNQGILLISELGSCDYQVEDMNEIQEFLENDLM